jgi:hypothetical protein
MTRSIEAWRAMKPEQRLAVAASLAMLVTMFFPWYGLQSVSKGEIKSHTINAFGDISFVEAAVFLVAIAVIAAMVARAEGREFHLPGGDGTIVFIAGAWAALLIFYRVFDRPAGHGYPVGIEWGFFLAFVATGTLAYAGWRIRTSERGQPPLSRARNRPPESDLVRGGDPDRDETIVRFADDRADADDRLQSHGGADDPDRPAAIGPVPARPRAAGTAEAPRPSSPSPRPPRARPRYPPSPSEQMSFEDSPPQEE